jgi:hypothetical protein
MFEVLNVWMFECLCPSIAGLKIKMFALVGSRSQFNFNKTGMDRFHKIAVRLKLPTHNKSDIWLDIRINGIYCLQTVFRYIDT